MNEEDEDTLKKKKIIEQLTKDKKKKIIEQFANMPAWSLAILLSSISILAAPVIYFLIIRYRAKNKKKNRDE